MYVNNRFIVYLLFIYLLWLYKQECCSWRWSFMWTELCTGRHIHAQQLPQSTSSLTLLRHQIMCIIALCKCLSLTFYAINLIKSEMKDCFSLEKLNVKDMNVFFFDIYFWEQYQTQRIFSRFECFQAHEFASVRW